MTLERHIIHVDMDAFFASVEQLDNPSLKNCPVIVGGSASRRGVVCAASYEARRFGIHSAMPMACANKLCPQAIVLPVRMERYSELSTQIHGVFQRFTPIVEAISIDEAFLDVTGSLKLFGDVQSLGKKIKSEIYHETQLICSVGIASNKFLAKLASDLQKPDGFVVIEKQNCQSILDPLTVGRIWGVGKKSLAKLEGVGIRTILDLRQADASTLQRLFGNETEHLLRLACGQDDRAVQPWSQRKSISAEQTFARDINDITILQDVLLDQVQQVACRLRRSDLKAQTVTLKYRHANFRTETQSHTLRESTATTETLWRVVKEMFSAKTTSQPLCLRLIGFGVNKLAGHEDGQQLTLFSDPDAEKQQSLDSAVDEINLRFGKSTIKRTGRFT